MTIRQKRNIGLWQACRNRKNKKGGENEIIIYSKFWIYGRTAVTGTVDFSGKVRGQAGKTPVAIKFLKDDGSQPLNNGVYEIVNIIDNKNIVLTSESDFVAETNLQVVILGTVPLGKVFTDAQMEGLYTYDWFTLGLTQEVTLEQPPTKSVNEFYIARVRNNGGTVTIDNTAKKEYWSLAGMPKPKE